LQQQPFISASDLQALDSFLLDQSYIHGWTVSEYDLVLYEHLAKTTLNSSPQYVNLWRWFNHVRTVVVLQQDGDGRERQKRKVTVHEVANLVLGRLKGEDDLDKKVRLGCVVKTRIRE
jgi:hypothetical protein